MKKLILIVAGLTVFAGTRYMKEWAPTATITVEAMSPKELKDLGWTTHSSSGLSNVGKGTLVYLRGSDAKGEAVSTFEWSITAPDGSSLSPDTQGQERTSFRPPTEGSYLVNLVITTASGSSAASVTINSASYVGVGSVAGQNPNFRLGQCAGCHADIAEKWEGTRHSTKFQRDIDGITTSFYRDSCLECHTVGYDLSASGNGGFDDIKAELGWAIPSALIPGNWQTMADNFPTLAAKANIQCENCHGPGSDHKGNKAGIGLSIKEGLCGQCHEAEPYHLKNVQWKNSLHGVGVPSVATRTGCADCHSTWGFIARMDPLSQHSQVTGEAPLSCAGCHDPHDATNENHLRRVTDIELVDGTLVTWGGKGKLCMNCHHARRDGATQAQTGGTRQDPHRSNQTDMLAATAANHFGRYIPSSTHRQALPDACVDCHMQPTPAAGQPGRNLLGEHTWKMSNLVDNTQLDHTAVCQRCHGEIESFDDIQARADYDGDGSQESTGDEITGLLDNLAMLLPPIGVPTFTVTNDYSTIQKQAAFNYNFVEEDGSHGIHNFQYSVGILQIAIEALKYGIAAPGDVTAVVDVPNDQGRQVHVAWTRFGGDGPSDDPVTTYYVWRKDNVVGKGITTTLDLVAGKAVGTSIDLAGEIWTAVASQPAAQLPAYAAVAPTLFDGDDNITKFMVTGHSRGGVVTMSVEREGFSIDNLVPGSPSGMVATVEPGGVRLDWTAPADPDVEYFAIYRSQSVGVVTGGSQPMATTTETSFVDATVALGTTYFYRVIAIDFSGNVGIPSAEVTASVATDNESQGIPTEFALHPNYPNPFNPSTTISFDLPVPSDISLVVYDVLGREVSRLLEAARPAGRHEVRLDASNWTSGLYFVRMRASGRLFERSIMLAK